MSLRRRAMAIVGVGLAVGLLASPLRAQALAAPDDLGPRFALLEPRSGFVGRLAVTPAQGPAGTVVEVRGEGLPPDRTFDLVWRTVEGRWNVTEAEYIGRAYTPYAVKLASVTTDARGAFSSRITVPRDFGFSHDIVVQDATRLLTQTGFQLDMGARIIGPVSGPVGSPIEVEVTGIGWRELEGSWVVLYDNKFTGFASAVTTRGTARFSLPAVGHQGRHIVEIQHSDFGSPYRNTQQSPTPDRPVFRLPFTITAGTPVLPAPPQTQRQHIVRRLPEPGAIRIDPPFAAVGDTVRAEVAGLVPGRRYQLDWNTLIGNRMSGRGWEQRTRPLVGAQADAAGRLAVAFEVPDDLGGAHEISLDIDGARKSGAFWLAPRALPLDVARGPVGTEFRIHLKGGGWSETANIYTVTYDNATSGYVCAFNSQGDVEIIMVATGEPGWHFIDLWPGIYKGRETRPNNYRMPQLTFADDHPGEDLPRFRFAFEVTPDAR